MHIVIIKKMKKIWFQLFAARLPINQNKISCILSSDKHFIKIIIACKIKLIIRPAIIRLIEDNSPLYRVIIITILKAKRAPIKANAVIGSLKPGVNKLMYNAITAPNAAPLDVPVV